MSVGPKQNTMTGILFMLAGTVFFSIGDSIGKWLTADYPVMQIAWIRSALGLLIIGGVAAFSGNIQTLKTDKPGWHIARSILSTGAILGIFYGLKYIPVAEFVSITFAAPFIIALFSPWVLKEKVSLQTWIAIITGLIGVLIVFRPTPDHFHPAHLVTFGVAVSIAALSITARILTKTESAFALNFYIYPANIILSCYFTFSTWVSPSITDWCLFLIQGTIATAALGCFIQSMRYARPAVVMPIDYSRIVWMSLIGYIIWQEVPETITWMGIVIIIVSGIYVVSHGNKLAELELDQETKTGAL